MRSKGSSAFAATMALMVAGGFLVLSAIGADTWVAAVIKEFIAALKESSGYNPEKYFRRVSLYGETRAQLEVLATNRYLQIYFLFAIATAGLSYIFVKKEMPIYNRRNRATLVALLLLMMLPMALATVTYGEIFAALATKVVSIAILILMGIFVTTEMMRVRPQGVLSRLFHLLVIALVFAQGVLLPGLYGWYVLLRNG
ncbi:MAG: hypothetical protein HYR56_27275 [Acidobacteria bacterium]|nr:hypothetical protein [Acidobacteriota bacterium]MBI3426384.1 hypothetical protein [Acidobacteriota bacterium]